MTARANPEKWRSIKDLLGSPSAPRPIPEDPAGEEQFFAFRHYLDTLTRVLDNARDYCNKAIEDHDAGKSSDMPKDAAEKNLALIPRLRAQLDSIKLPEEALLFLVYFVALAHEVPSPRIWPRKQKLGERRGLSKAQEKIQAEAAERHKPIIDWILKSLKDGKPPRGLASKAAEKFGKRSPNDDDPKRLLSKSRVSKLAQKEIAKWKDEQKKSGYIAIAE